MRSRLIVLVVVMTMLAAAYGGETGGEPESGEAEGGGSRSEPTSSGGEADEELDAGLDQGGEPAESSAPPSGDSGGLYTVDDESIGGDLYNSDPGGGAGDAESGDLELVVRSESGGGLSIDAWHDSRGLLRFSVRFNRTTDVVEQYESVFDQDADGNWTANLASPVTLNGPPFTVDGNRIMGEVTLLQEVPEGTNGSVKVTFDFEIPELSC